MDTGKFVGLLVFFLVGALVLMAFVPAIQETTSATNTFTNDGYYTMDKVSSDSEFTLTWDYTEPTSIDIDGVKIDLSNAGLTPGKSYTIFGADNFVLRLYWTATAPYCQYFGDASVIPSFMQANVPTASKLTATVTNETITFASTDPSYTTPVTIPLKDTTYCINPAGNGDYVMKKASDSVYIESNTDIIVLDGITTLTANDVGIYADGTINGDLDATTFRGTGTYDVTFSDFVYTTENVTGYIDLVKLEKVDFTATQNDTDYTVTYSYFIVPVEVTAEKEYHADTTLATVINLLPLIAGVGLLMFLVAEFLYTRYL